MWSLRAGLSALLLGLVGCSSKSESAAPPAGDTIGIEIVAASGLPKLQIRVTLPAGLEPGPHVQPLAQAIVNARAKCFSTGVVPRGVVVSVHGDVSSKQIHAVSQNSWGSCLAKAIDGAKLDDASSFPVDLQVNVVELDDGPAAPATAPVPVKS
jgi:hypothetical protein